MIRSLVRLHGPMLLACVMCATCGAPERQDATTPPVEPAASTYIPTSASVSIAGMNFRPDTLHVHRGDTVVFTNNDVVDHDVTELPDSSWTSGLLHPGASWTWVADSTSYYFCSIHVVMRGRVVVE